MFVCPVCSSQFHATTQFPECPECIRKRFQHPGAIAPRHTLQGSQASTRKYPPSYAALDGNMIFDYMAYGPHTEPSGLTLVRSSNPNHQNRINAISYKPIGEIPGSGVIRGSGDFAAEYAVLIDIEGKSKDGPHFMFEEQSSVANRLQTGDWVLCPKCAKCQKFQVYNLGDTCIPCKAAGSP